MPKGIAVAEVLFHKILNSAQEFKFSPFFVLFAICFLACVSCNQSSISKNNSSNSYQRISNNPPDIYRVDSSEDETKQEIESYLTTLRFEGEEYERAWERVVLFFKLHAGKNIQVSLKGTSKTINGSSDKLNFEVVSNKIDKSSYKISVYSAELDNTQSDKSIINAKNIARFIDKGQLEVGLLN